MENADTLTTQEIVVYFFIHAFLLLLRLYFIELSDDLKCCGGFLGWFFSM